MPAPTFYARSLTEIIALRADTQPEDVAVYTGAAEFGEKLLSLTYSDLSKAVDRLAHHYANPTLNLLPNVPPSEIPPERVISVLTSTAIDESLLEIALARLGLAALLLSVNNSTAAVAHLCKQTKSHHLIYGTRYETTAREAQVVLKEEGYDLVLVPETRYPLWGPGGVRDSSIKAYPPRLTPAEEAKRTAVLLHSSGSTGFPKPVFITHYGLIANMSSSVPQTGFSALPLFHGFGHFSIFRCIYHGKSFTLMPPNLPLTSANICRIIKASPDRPRQHFAVPYVLKLLAETDEGTETLASFDTVSFAGAAVPDDLGDRLAAAGVPLVSCYGTTETGQLFTSRREYASDKSWNWLRATGLISNYLELVPHGENTFEVIVKDGFPAKIMSNREDGAYCTKDLFLRHPDHEDWFKYIGRLDDTLTQTLGEKTNPVPIELAIRGNSPLIQECIVFGDGRPQIGCLLHPSDIGAELSKDPAAYLKAVWPVIEDANSRSPTHSRILLEMIAVLPYGTEIPVATKMSILRPACYKKFGSLISSIYEQYEKGSAGQPKKVITDQSEMEVFLKETIEGTFGGKEIGKLELDTDLFGFGVDSLQATKVRNLIGRSLDLGDVTLGQNIVYEHPSIRQLAQYLLNVGEAGTSGSSVAAAHERMTQMVDEWSAKVASRSLSQQNSGEGQVVVLTGATGSLGAHILTQLIESPAVSKVICLSRAKSHDDSMRRLTDSLTQRLCQRTPEARRKITSYAADVNADRLGLTAGEYESIKSSCTAVIHNAWPVNFVLSLESFAQHIRGAVNLLNLAQTASHPSTFLFSSSVATRQGRPDPIVDETFSDSPGTAAPMGYGRSKWVVEKICQRAAEEKNASVGIFRIGQLAGDTVNGVWNETEAWPLMFKSVQQVKSLPVLDERPSWLPVDQAAKAIAEITLSSSSSASGGKVYHILNPHLASWRDILNGLRKGGLKFDEVDRKDWVRRLGQSTPDLDTNPTYKLLTFYQNRIGGDSERREMEFKVDQTASVSNTMGGLKAVDENLVALWTTQWTKTGFL